MQTKERIEASVGRKKVPPYPKALKVNVKHLKKIEDDPIGLRYPLPFWLVFTWSELTYMQTVAYLREPFPRRELASRSRDGMSPSSLGELYSNISYFSLRGHGNESCSLIGS